MVSKKLSIVRVRDLGFLSIGVILGAAITIGGIAVLSSPTQYEATSTSQPIHLDSTVTSGSFEFEIHEGMRVNTVAIGPTTLMGKSGSLEVTNPNGDTLLNVTLGATKTKMTYSLGDTRPGKWHVRYSLNGEGLDSTLEWYAGRKTQSEHAPDKVWGIGTPDDKNWPFK